MTFAVYCHHCETRHLMTKSSVKSFHNTSEGPIAYVVCPHGHYLVHQFRNGGDLRSASAMMG